MPGTGGGPTWREELRPSHGAIAGRPAPHEADPAAEGAEADAPGGYQGAVDGDTTAGTGLHRRDVPVHVASALRSRITAPPTRSPS